MKKQLMYVMASAMIMAVAFVGCKKDDKKKDVEDVTMEWETYSLEVGDEVTLNASVSPSDADNTTLTWSSDNAAVTVDAATGKITAVSVGNAIVKATSAANSALFGFCKVKVVSAPNMANLDTTSTPNWGSETLGTVTFASDETWTINNLTWSDAVVASVCKDRAEFNGGNSISGFKADCRNNKGMEIVMNFENYPTITYDTVRFDFEGSLFSYATVARFRKQLCPEGWRVPTKDDFQALYVGLGGTGESMEDSAFTKKFVDDWGAELNGTSDMLLGLLPQNKTGVYWSMTQHTTNSTANCVLVVGLDNEKWFADQAYNVVRPAHSGGKNNGYSLRCVR